MKVVIDSPIEVKPFDELAFGMIFLYKNEFYMKIRESNGRYTALNLSDGRGNEIQNIESVISIDAELHIV